MHERIAQALDAEVVSLSKLSGGCAGDVRLAELRGGGRVVVKLGPRGSRLDIEGAMLGDLRGRLCVPGVRHASDEMLIMDYIEHGGAVDASGERQAAEMLASLHANTSDRFGYGYDTLIGGLHQPNGWAESWPAFFGEQRLVHMARAAHRGGRLSDATCARVERLAGEGLDELVGDSGGPSLIHGDVWGGNVLAHRGRVRAFIDPAVYYADTEIELAFIRLFGTFGDAFFERYHEIRPIRDGFFELRSDLYNLYPLLVHARLFGGGYAQSVEGVLDRLGC